MHECPSQHGGSGEDKLVLLPDMAIAHSWLGVRRTPSQPHSLQQIPTQHDMLPQHLVYKNELNREYVLTLARNDGTP